MTTKNEEEKTNEYFVKVVNMLMDFFELNEISPSDACIGMSLLCVKIAKRNGANQKRFLEDMATAFKCIKE